MGAISNKKLFRFTSAFSSPSLKFNTLSNFIGSAWTAFISLIFVPVYLHRLGVDAYGLIGVFATLQTFLWLFDFGLSATLNRELARLSTLAEKKQEMRDTTRTLELFNWVTAVLLGILLLSVAPLLARYWVRSEQLTITDLTQCFAILGASFAIQWTTLLYNSGLAGLQKQVLLNSINMFSVTLRSIGSIVILIYVSNTIQAFLIWQVVTTILQALLLAGSFWANLPKSHSPARFRLSLLKNIWRFAVGMTGIGLVSLILVQADKVILSRMLTLEYFGYYSLATAISSMVLVQISNALSNAIYPRFSQLVALKDEVSLRRLYHQSCQLLSTLLLPTAAILVFFSTEILQIWTRNQTVTSNTHLLLSLVAAGTGTHGLMWIPYQLQLAHGWTKLSFYVNVVAVLFLIPTMIIAVINFGAVGGAASWLTLSISYVLIGIPLMHRKILKGEKSKWYLVDVGLPLITTVSLTALSYRTLPSQSSTAVTIIWLALTWISCVLLTAFLSPSIREKLFEIIHARYPNFRWRNLSNAS